jgi:hypothetical protein
LLWGLSEYFAALIFLSVVAQVKGEHASSLRVMKEQFDREKVISAAIYELVPYFLFSATNPETPIALQ